MHCIIKSITGCLIPSNVDMDSVIQEDSLWSKKAPSLSPFGACTLAITVPARSPDATDTYKATDISSNPYSYFNNLPSIFPEILLKKSTFKIMWSEKEFNSLKNNFPEIESFLIELKRSVRTKLSQDEFENDIKMLTEEPMLDSVSIASLYDFYSSGIDALQEFAKSPRGLEMTILSEEGINLIPEKQLLDDFLKDEINSFKNKFINKSQYYKRILNI